MVNELKALLQPIEVGPLRLKNRMVRSPMWSGLGSIEGEVTQQLLDTYATSAKGGPAMIIGENMAVDGRHRFLLPQPRIDEPKFMSGLHRLVEVIHLNGALCEFQLHCAGALGTDPISPSGVPCYGEARATPVEPRVMSLSEIEEVRDLFIAGAVRAKQVGCDGVDIHAGTSYLLQQFVSPHTNKRTDRWGGSFENRIRLPLEIVRGILKQCGPSFAIGCSIVADELQPDGIHIEDAIAFAKVLEQEGIHYLSMMVGTYETFNTPGGRGMTFRQRRGYFEEAGFLRELKNVKVFARTWGEMNPVRWEEALEKGQADVIQIGRSLFSDPELPKKVAEGRLDDIRLCTRCGHCVEQLVIKGFQVSCAQNPELGRERDYDIKRTTSQVKRVLVIGGGPGGLEAARVAALRGHDVTLMEKAAELGGNINVASHATGKQELRTYFIAWLERQCKKAGVKIELNKEATPIDVEEFEPDVVIVATGAIPLTPPIPGLDKPHVCIAADVLTGKAHVGEKVVVIGGGGIGVDAADFIAENGLAKSVIILARHELGVDMIAKDREYTLKWVLPNWGVNGFSNMHISEITDDAVIAVDEEWNTHRFEADTVVNAMGYLPNSALYEALEGKVPEIYRIGDCVNARSMFEAVHEAAYIARQI